MEPDENKTKEQLIAELKLTRKQLAMTEFRSENAKSQAAKFKSLTENSVTGVFIVQDSLLAYVNPSMAHMLGYEPREIAGKLTLTDLVHPDHQEMAMLRMRQRLAGEIQERNIAYKALKKNGALIYVEVFGVRTEYNGSPAIMGTIIDVTERIQVEEAYRVLVDTSLQAAIILQQGRIVFANLAAEKISGYNVQELQDMQNPIQRLIHPADLPAILRRVEKRNRGQKVAPFARYRIIQKSGEPRWVESQTAPIEYGGEPAEHIVYIDISDRIQAEQEIRRAESRFRDMIEHTSDAVFCYEYNPLFQPTFRKMNR